jgi:hypothetical protein
MGTCCSKDTGIQTPSTRNDMSVNISSPTATVTLDDASLPLLSEPSISKDSVSGISLPVKIGQLCSQVESEDRQLALVKAKQQFQSKPDSLLPGVVSWNKLDDSEVDYTPVSFFVYKINQLGIGEFKEPRDDDVSDAYRQFFESTFDFLKTSSHSDIGAAQGLNSPSIDAANFVKFLQDDSYLVNVCVNTTIALFLKRSDPDALSKKEFPLDGNVLDIARQGRLFEIDLSFVDLPKSNQGVSIPPMLAIFEKDSNSDVFRILGISIKTANSKFFNPNDGELWNTAKLFFCGCLHFAQIVVSRLGQSQLFLEPILVSLNRNLPELHPIFQILFQHGSKVLFNGEVWRNVFLEKLILSQITGVDNGSILKIVSQVALQQRQQFGSLRRVLKSNGTFELQTPFFIGLRRMWGIVFSWISEYVKGYYSQSHVLSEDHEVQDWIADCRDNFKLEFLKDWKRFADNREILIELICTFIFEGSIIPSLFRPFHPCLFSFSLLKKDISEVLKKSESVSSLVAQDDVKASILLDTILFDTTTPLFRELGYNDHRGRKCYRNLQTQLESFEKEWSNQISSLPSFGESPYTISKYCEALLPQNLRQHQAI